MMSFSLKRLIHLFSGPGLFTFNLLWFMVLLILGTITQRTEGLYSAQQTYFTGWIFWGGPFPLPSGLTVLSLMILNLAFKLCRTPSLFRKNLGSTCIHGSILCVLLSITLQQAIKQEGYITLKKGQETHEIADFFDKELILFQNGQPVESWLSNSLRKKQPLSSQNLLQFTLTPLRYGEHTQLQPREKVQQSRTFHGSAQRLDFKEEKMNGDPEESKASLLIQATFGTESATYLLSEHLSQQAYFKIGADIFSLQLQKHLRKLPFSLTLEHFKKEHYPGSTKAKAYKSFLKINDPPITWSAKVEMNKPLRYKGYTFYQSSYQETAQDKLSILTVVKDGTWPFLYLACGLLILGFIIHFIQRFSILFILILCPVFTFAHTPQKDFNFSEMRALPVYHDGRIKPLDTVARLYLKHFSNKESLDDTSAITWFSSVIFQDHKALQEPCFKLPSSDFRELLNLPHKTLYSFQELFKALAPYATALQQINQTPLEHLTPHITQLLSLQEKLSLFADLLTQKHSLKAPLIKEASGETVTRFSEHPLWQNLQKSYDENLPILWDKTLHSLKANHPHLFFEVILNQFDFFFYVLILTLCAVLTLLLHFFWRQTPFKNLLLALLFLSFLSQATGLLGRFVILQRPPVTSLYESILFVNFLILSFGILTYFFSKKVSSPLIKTAPFFAISLILSLLSQAYGKGETFQMPIAVLNTHFWLSLHVITITTGYALTLTTASYAYFLLITPLIKKEQIKQKSLKTLHRLLLVSLAFCLIGTLFGGIWADHSWGRFWGWDPKENGALLLVVWILFLVHGRLSQTFSDLTYTTLSAASILIVTLSWFGVNLLGIGLHAYGFDEENPFKIYFLITFCTLNFIFLYLLYLLYLKQNRIPL